MKKTLKGITGGAAILGIGAFIAKLTGALYRIPLTNLLGGYGLGLYQMVFPVYSLLLDFSGAAVPSALSKLVAEKGALDVEYRAESYLRSSLRLLFFLGIIGTLAMASLAYPISIWQGDSSAFVAYLALSPAIFFVSLICCFRGYFQGLMNMTPTAVSQVVEQIIKLVLGLFFVKLLLPKTPLAVAGATFAITISEVIALIVLYCIYKWRKNKLGLSFELKNTNFAVQAKSILRTAIPITLVGIMIPLSQVVDSFIIVNVLSTYRTDATCLYGLNSGVVATVINLPVSVCYGIAMATIPAVSGALNAEHKNKNAVKTLLLTIVVAMPCAIGAVAFAPLIIKILFGGLSAVEKSVSVLLLKISSPIIVLLSFLQTANAVLIGKGRLYAPVISLGIGIAVKTVLNLILLKMPELNIYGSAVATIACYFTVCLINLIMIFTKKVKDADTSTCDRQ